MSPNDPLLWLVGLALMMAIMIGAILVLMWLAGAMGWHKAALAIGALGALYFAGTALHTMVFCAGGAVTVAEGADGAERLVEVCQGPGQTLSYAYAQIAAPVAALFLAVSTWRRWSQLKEVHHG